MILLNDGEGVRVVCRTTAVGDDGLEGPRGDGRVEGLEEAIACSPLGQIGARGECGSGCETGWCGHDGMTGEAQSKERQLRAEGGCQEQSQEPAENQTVGGKKDTRDASRPPSQTTNRSSRCP